MSVTLSHERPQQSARAASMAQSILAWLVRQPLIALALGVAFAMAAADIALDPYRLALTLGDTDDATRLTEVRQLLAGQPWFDMSLPRFGGADPLISHWSRIIDVPLAALIWLFSVVTSADHAELAARALWPTLLLGVMAYCVARYCDTVAQRSTALLALALAVPCTGHFQFTPGRIDHHSGMIIGAVGGTLALLAAIDRPKLGWLAGILLGVGCAIGYEGLLLTLGALAIVTLSCIATRDNLSGIVRAGAAFAATLAILFNLFGPVGPNGLVVCDALSVNLIALATCGAFGIGLAHVSRLQGEPPLAGLAYVAAAGLAGLALYGITEPICLGGPFAQVEPRLGPVWLDHVAETRSLISIFQSSPSEMMSLAAYPLTALVYGFMVVRGRHMPHAGTFYAIFLVTLGLGIYQVKLLPYASFLCVPLIAAGLTRRMPATEPALEHVPIARTRPATLAGPRERKNMLYKYMILEQDSHFDGLSVPCGTDSVRNDLALVPVAPAKRWFDAPVSALLVMTGALAAIIFAIAIVNITSGSQANVALPAAAKNSAEGYATCTNADNIKPLAALAPGLAANDIDLGPYLVAWTKLDVLSAPYHRLGRSILATHDLLHASASEAKARMQKLGATYVIVCPALGDTVADFPAPADALRTALLSGQAPDFLESVEIGKGNVKVWRLRAD